MSRTKIKGDEYICSKCDDMCSKYIRKSRFTKEELQGHMEYMKRSDRIFKEVIGGFTKGDCIPYPNNRQTFQFFDDHGMFIIRDGSRDKDERYPIELFRYDQLASYEPYFEDRDPRESGKPREFVEGGVKLTFVGGLDNPNDIRKGSMGHPYITDPIKVCMAKTDREREDNLKYVDNIMAHFDHVFGVHDSQRGLFQFGMTKEEKRNLKAGVAFVNTFVDAVKAAKQGEELLTEEKKAEIQANMNAMNDANTGGLSVYTRRADETEAKLN
ncbi:MAG: hypothetical protein IKJ68_12860 [Clostridia bacterium]|nr:hypothetical protein [Clostridia bacterium]